jgi:hypothetical protein
MIPPTILFGGNGPRVVGRGIAYGDECIPMLRPGVLDHIAEFKKTARKPGSDEPIPVTRFGGELTDVDAIRPTRGLKPSMATPPNPAHISRRHSQGVSATEATYRARSSKPRSTLHSGPTNPWSKSNSPSLRETRGVSVAALRSG